MTSQVKSVKQQDGSIVKGIVVGIEESTERFSIIRLEDGTVLKTKLSPIEVLRVDGSWDDEGNPMYVLKSHNVVTVAETLLSQISKNNFKEQ